MTWGVGELLHLHALMEERSRERERERRERKRETHLQPQGESSADDKEAPAIPSRAEQ